MSDVVIWLLNGRIPAMRKGASEGVFRIEYGRRVLTTVRSDTLRVGVAGAGCTGVPALSSG